MSEHRSVGGRYSGAPVRVDIVRGGGAGFFTALGLWCCIWPLIGIAANLARIADALEATTP